MSEKIGHVQPLSKTLERFEIVMVLTSKMALKYVLYTCVYCGCHKSSNFRVYKF